jgi:heme O synthase-like polyprenyltransferase
MSDDNDWLFGFLAALAALVGLLIAGTAGDLGMSLFGWGLLVYGVLYTYWTLKRHFDREDERGS